MIPPYLAAVVARLAAHGWRSRHIHLGWFDRWDEELFAAQARLSEVVLERAGALHGTIVDVGCGVGGTLAAARGPGRRLIGVNIDPVQIAALPDGVEGVLADATATGLPDACADVVLSVEMAFHVDRVALARELRRLCRPGGRIVVWDLVGAGDADFSRLEGLGPWPDPRGGDWAELLGAEVEDCTARVLPTFRHIVPPPPRSLADEATAALGELLASGAMRAVLAVDHAKS